MAGDNTIIDVVLLSVLLLGEIQELFSEQACDRIEHRVIFNGPQSRKAINTGKASYQLLHLSDMPRQVRQYLKPNVVFLIVSGPDNGGNFSYGTSVEACKAAVTSARAQGGLVIAERNAKMPFVLGTTIHECLPVFGKIPELSKEIKRISYVHNLKIENLKHRNDI